MPHEPNWKYAQKVGPAMTQKEVVEVYDDYYGKYACNTEDAKTDTLRPSKDTKKPFALSGGGK